MFGIFRFGTNQKGYSQPSYACPQPLSIKTTLSAGIGFGVSSVNVDRSKIYFATLDPNDPAIGYASNELKKVKPEITAGLWLYAPNYFIGMSVANIIPGKNSFVSNTNYGEYFTLNYFLTGGYRFNLTDDINWIPSFMYQYWKPQLSGLHVNNKFQYRDLVWLGAGCRFSNLISGYSPYLGMNIGNAVNVSYSYEVATTSRLRNYSGNTHEILIGFIIGNKFGDGCPRIQL